MVQLFSDLVMQSPQVYSRWNIKATTYLFIFFMKGCFSQGAEKVEPK